MPLKFGKWYKRSTQKRPIHIIGVGMGNPKNMTVEAVEAVEDCQVLIGANRLVDAVNKGRKDIYYEYKAEKIKEFIDTTDYQHYGIIFQVTDFSAITLSKSSFSRNMDLPWCIFRMLL